MRIDTNVDSRYHLSATSRCTWAVLAIAATTLLTTRPARADALIGIEWEFGWAGFGAVKWADNGDTLVDPGSLNVAIQEMNIFCTTAKTREGFPLLKVTADLRWTGNTPASTLELVSAPIDDKDNPDWGNVEAAATQYFTAFASACAAGDGVYKQIDLQRACLVKAESVFTKLESAHNGAWEWCADNGPAKNATVDKPSAALLVKNVGSSVGKNGSDLSKYPWTSNINTQVNVEVPLASIAAGKLLTAYGNQIDAAKRGYQASLQKLASGNQTVEQKGVLALIGAGIAADLASRTYQRESGKYALVNALAYSELKNMFDAYLKTPLTDNHLQQAIPAVGVRETFLRSLCPVLKVSYPQVDDNCVLHYYTYQNGHTGPLKAHEETIDLVQKWARWEDVGNNAINPWEVAKPLEPLTGDNKVVIEIRNRTTATGAANLSFRSPAIKISRLPYLSQAIGVIVGH